jgi:hypothetical protein
MTIDETLHDTFETLGDRLRAELRTAADQLTDALRMESETVARPLAVESTPAAKPHDGLPDAVRSIGAARSLSAILDTLADCAARDAARAAVLLVRGGRFRGWRFAGFGSDIAAPHAIDIGDDDGGVLTEALRTGAPVSGPAVGSSVAPAFAALPPERECVALPIAIGGQVVAILYADEGIGTAIASGDRLDIGRLDVLASYAARCLEAQTAFKAARALLDRLHRGEGQTVRALDEAADDGGPADGDIAARRYARLLVSEIKLYHEQAVLAGRRERDLATRLGDEIARARLLYDQRVPPLRERTDYFHSELVRTLADGDASLMALHS